MIYKQSTIDRYLLNIFSTKSKPSSRYPLRYLIYRQSFNLFRRMYFLNNISSSLLLTFLGEIIKIISSFIAVYQYKEVFYYISITKIYISDISQILTYQTKRYIYISSGYSLKCKPKHEQSSGSLSQSSMLFITKLQNRVYKSIHKTIYVHIIIIKQHNLLQKKVPNKGTFF